MRLSSEADYYKSKLEQWKQKIIALREQQAFLTDQVRELMASRSRAQVISNACTACEYALRVQASV